MNVAVESAKSIFIKIYCTCEKFQSVARKIQLLLASAYERHERNLRSPQIEEMRKIHETSNEDAKCSL